MRARARTHTHTRTHARTHTHTHAHTQGKVQELTAVDGETEEVGFVVHPDQLQVLGQRVAAGQLSRHQKVLGVGKAHCHWQAVMSQHVRQWTTFIAL